MNLIKLKAIITPILIVFFLLVLFTGIGLYLAPNGKIARETAWNFFGLTKTMLENMHTITGTIMSILAIIHLTLNHNLLTLELKKLIGK